MLFQNAFEAALLTFLAGSPRRYGYATDGRRLLLSDPIPRPGKQAVAHQVEYYLGMLRPLGCEEQALSPRLVLFHEEETAMARRLTESGISGAELLIGLNPGSTYGGAKRWLPERFAETADRLAAQFGAKVLIVGAHGEEALAQAIAGRIQAKTIVLSGKTSVRELMAAVKRCAVFITNDTGPMHIAAAFGVPVVAVFGPTDSRTTAPFGAGHALVRQPVDCSPCLLRECPIDHRCMTRVTVDEVCQAAIVQLASRQAPASDAPRSAPGTQHLPLHGVTVFLDRDGTTNRDTGYIKTPDELQIFPGAVEAVARLKQAGARVVMITNQSGIGRGLFSVETLGVIHARLHRPPLVAVRGDAATDDRREPHGLIGTNRAVARDLQADHGRLRSAEVFCRQLGPVWRARRDHIQGVPLARRHPDSPHSDAVRGNCGDRAHADGAFPLGTGRARYST